MAFVSDLVATIAEVENMPESTVGLVARYAREAGFLSQGARGRNAPHATVRDCANLLIAVNAMGNRLKDVPQIIDTFRQMVLKVKLHSLSDLFHFLHKDDLPFGDALEAVLCMFVDGTAQSYYVRGLSSIFEPTEFGWESVEGSETPPTDEEKFEWFNSAHFSGGLVQVAFQQPSFAVRIIQNKLRRTDDKGQSEVVFLPTVEAYGTGLLANRKGDRIQETTIGHRTLAAVAALLR